MNNYESIRSEITEMLKHEFSVFEYKGHGAHIGIWETPDMQHLEKPFGDSFDLSKFRLWVFFPNQWGQQIKIEVMLSAVGEWETVFEGYIESFGVIPGLLNFNFGLKSLQQDS